MTWIKICGMTNLEDALCAVEAGADAVGFVFCAKSPRNVSVDTARQIIEQLPEEMEKIGVFIHGEHDATDILLKIGLTGTQTYISGEGNDRGVSGRAIGVGLLPKKARFMTAVPMKFMGTDAEQIQASASNFAKWRENIPNIPEEISIPDGLLGTFVLDSGDVALPGGTGKIFDWRKAIPIAEGMRQGGVKLVVAGGLTPANVGEAMSILQPWGVDVVSGVEASPGKKDPEKVRAFVRAVREIDRKAS
ncbi:MAG: phosphoribosylanthranilate isomerase [Candidatus Sulfotelmatobacter sp.]